MLVRLNWEERNGPVTREREILISSSGLVELDGQRTRGRMFLGAALLSFANEWKHGRAVITQESGR